MFEQTFVNVAGERRRPYVLALSSFAQICVLGILILIPLFYTQVLPNVQLRSVLAAPAPPPAPGPTPPRVVTKIQAHAAAGPRIFNMTSLLSPSRVMKNEEASLTTAPPEVGMGTGVDGGAAVTIGSALPEAAPAPSKKEPARLVRQGGTVSEANLIHRVPPVYPPIARTTHIEGVVEFTATISKAGTIEHLQLVRGHPLLVNAAEEAILQWRYRPTLLNGEPVEVITDITVKFTLSTLAN